jgi:hypothetical protein
MDIDYYMSFFILYPLSDLGHDISPRAILVKLREINMIPLNILKQNSVLSQGKVLAISSTNI